MRAACRRACLALGLCASAACGATPRSAPPAAAPAVAEGAPRERPAASGWGGLDWEQRHDAMTFLVLPVMARRFQVFRGSAAPDLRCTTCHGEDAEAVGYTMPHGLMPLDPRSTPGPGSDLSGAPPVVRFMLEEVTPLMVDLLDVEPFDPATGRGFTCFNCHESSADSQPPARFESRANYLAGQNR